MPPQGQVAATAQPKRWPLRILSIVYGLLIVPGLFVAFSAIFAFDAPGSENSPITNLFAFSAGIVPLVLLVSSVGGLICSFGRQSNNKAIAVRIFGWLPIMNLALFILSIVLLQTLCGGKFVCQL